MLRVERPKSLGKSGLVTVLRLQQSKWGTLVLAIELLKLGHGPVSLRLDFGANSSQKIRALSPLAPIGGQRAGSFHPPRRRASGFASRLESR